MSKNLQVFTRLKQKVQILIAIAICFFTLTNYTYSQVYDISLINGVSSSFGPDFCPGDLVRVNSAIYNTGDIEACNIEITAYIPEGMTLSDDPLNSRWTLDGSVLTTVIETCIPPGGTYPDGVGSLQLSFVQTIQPNFTGDVINIYTEISADDGDDIDSTPDQDFTNDAGAEPGTDTDNSIHNSNDEDDHDVAQISLRECDTQGCTDPCAPNYDAEATVDDDSCDSYSTTCNMDICAGDVAAWSSESCSCEVTVPQVLGCTDGAATNYDPAANCLEEDSCTYPETGCTDPCAPNYNSSAVADDGSCESYSTTCNMDICAGDVAAWSEDSCGCEVTVTQVLGCTDGSATNFNAAANCNDDSCEYETGDYDLALIKGISSSLPTEYCPGDEVRFNMAIYNQGDIQACDVEVTEYIPDGMSLSDNANNSIWSGSGSIITTTIVGCIPSGGVYPNDSNFPLSVWLTIDADFTGTSISNYGEISSDDGNDVDSTPDQDPDNDGGADPSTGTDNTVFNQNGDEDDHDVVVITIKPSCAVESGCTDPCAPNYDASASEDDGSCDDYSTDCNTDICDGDITTWTPSVCGCEVETPQVLGCTDADANNYDADANCDDDSCTYGLDGCTNSEACNYNPAATVDDGSCIVVQAATISGGPFTFCVGDGIEDYVSGITVSDGVGDNTAWVVTNDELEILGLPTMPGDVNFDDAPSGVCLIWYVTFDDITGAEEGMNAADLGGCFALSNSIEVTREKAGCTDPDATNYDSSADCDDSSCTYNVERIDLSLEKTLDRGQTTISPCDDVIFTVEVCNLGTVTVYNVEVTDILPDGFRLSHGDNFGWEINEDGDYSQTIDEGIAPGDCVSLPISVKPLLAADPGTYTNNATISAMTDVDGDSIMDEDASNNSSSSDITIVDTVFDLALIMYPVADQPTTVEPGDDVTFVTSVYNRGGQIGNNIEVTTYIPDGMSLSSTDDNADWVDNGDGTATQTLSGSLLPCRAVSFFVTLTVAEDAAPGVYNTIAEISAANDTDGNPGMDVDSTMDTDPTNDAGGNANSPSDNHISGDGTGFPGSTDYDSDEDDSDPVEIIVSSGLFFGNTTVNNSLMKLNKVEKSSTLRIDRLFPTITDGKLNLIVEASNNLSTIIQIVDFEGKVLTNEVYQLKESMNSLTFNVSNLPNGMYFLNTITGEQIITNKFLKN